MWMEVMALVITVVIVLARLVVNWYDRPALSPIEEVRSRGRADGAASSVTAADVGR